jgi:hypothetical protein
MARISGCFETKPFRSEPQIARHGANRKAKLNGFV